MKLRLIWTGILLGNGLIPSAVVAQDPPVLDELIMQLSVESAKLSSLAYANATDYESGTDENGATTYTHPDYEEISFYTDEPDQAIVAKKDGRCFLSFRGTTQDIDDWFQNTGLGSVDVYKNNDTASGEFCNARGGFADFLYSPLVQQGAADLIACAGTCSDPDDCMYLTGHSQGGAISQLAMILLEQYNPILISFGAPLAVSRDCEIINSERVYRYVNSVYDEEEPEIDYDPVPLLPGFGQGRGHYGYYLLLGDDTTALKYIGIDDEQAGFAPGAQTSAAPHSMGAEAGDFSYESRVTAIYDNGVFPVAIEGFSGGTPCDVENTLTCASNECNDIAIGCVAAAGAPTDPAPTDAGTPAPPTEEGAPTAAPTVATTNEGEPTAAPTSSAASVFTCSSVLVCLIVTLFL